MKLDNSEAFALIYEEFWKPLLTYAGKRLLIPQDAEEVVQDVFVSLWERRHTLDIHGSLDAYLHTAVRYRIYNRYREYLKNKEAIKIPGLKDMNYSLPVSEIVEGRELEIKIHDAVNTLPAKCREAFLLSREEKLPNKVIAMRLGISVNTVEKHIGKALHLLRIKFKDELAILVVCSITGLM